MTCIRFTNLNSLNMSSNASKINVFSVDGAALKEALKKTDNFIPLPKPVPSPGFGSNPFPRPFPPCTGAGLGSFCLA